MAVDGGIARGCASQAAAAAFSKSAEFYVSSKKQLTNYTNMVFNKCEGSDIMIVKQTNRLPRSRNGGNANELPDPDQ